MFTKILARSTRLARPTNVLRRGGHGTPSYNEPGGYLFNEKVNYKTTKSSYINNHSPRFYPHQNNHDNGMLHL